MGVSLQVYRVRIGTFNPSVREKTAKEQAGYESSKFIWNYKRIFYVLLLFCSLVLFVQLFKEDFILNSSPTQYQSTTACDPSHGSLCVTGMPWTNPPVPPDPIKYFRRLITGNPISSLYWTTYSPQAWTITPWPPSDPPAQLSMTNRGLFSNLHECRSLPSPAYATLLCTIKCCRQPQARSQNYFSE